MCHPTQKLRFGGNVESNCFGLQRNRPSRFDLNKLLPRLEKVANRLSCVVLENLDFEEFIKRYDSKEALFYLDPPYYNCEDYYGKDLFKRKDFIRLCDTLGIIKGKLILSINDVPEIRKMFEQFCIKEVQTTYSISNTKRDKVGELLIFNYAV